MPLEVKIEIEKDPNPYNGGGCWECTNCGQQFNLFPGDNFFAGIICPHCEK